MPFNPLRNPDQMQQLEGEDAGVQFSHSLEEQIGGQLEAGFILLSLYEDTNGEGRLHELNIPNIYRLSHERNRRYHHVVKKTFSHPAVAERAFSLILTLSQTESMICYTNHT